MTPMEPNDRLAETPRPDWKWEALFAMPPGLERQWQAWLAAAQQAENDALLTYWARRVPR